MSGGPSSVWQDILDIIRSRHPQVVRGWFHDLRLVGLEQGVVAVQTRNQAQVQYLAQHCLRAFTEAAQAVTGRLVSVAFDPDPAAPEEDTRGRALYYDPDDELALDPERTFDNFVVGPSNRLAHAAATAVVDAPGTAYNPLFLYGASGLGKTHLVQAICHKLRDASAGASVCYTTCEMFVNHFVDAMERQALPQFRARYRNVDVLVLDDVQFLAKGERVQEEFFHTFNTLQQFRRQIVLTADSDPSDIAELEERLVTRLHSGLVVLLDRPCLETRIGIVRRKATLRGYDVPRDVAELIARTVDQNIREIEGALNKVDALSQLLQQPITCELAQEALGKKPARVPSFTDVLEAVSRRTGVRVSDIIGKDRSRALTRPRQLAMHLSRQLCSLSWEDVGRLMGGRDHSTVLHASRAVARDAEKDAELRALLDELSAEVKNAVR